MNPKQLIFPFAIDQSPAFDTFFWGDKNRFLLDELRGAINSSTNQEVFIMGLEGSGKSFILQAICNEYISMQQKVMYIPMYKAVEMDSSLLENFEEFDAVCVDDVQALEKNPDWQTAVFHLINQANNSNCSLYFSSSRDLDTMGQTMLDDLISRFTRMNHHNVHPIGEAELSTALFFCASSLEISLEDDVLEYLLKRETRQLHHLLKLLKRVDHAAAQDKRKLTIPFVKQVLYQE
jgi:DnaA family protein|tara:strand:- start:2245 stop:2949 length:705 start_codon:yes stop_codon:yes gene_type:complete